jgi:hypothetical protein
LFSQCKNNIFASEISLGKSQMDSWSQFAVIFSAELPSVFHGKMIFQNFGVFLPK